MAGGAVLLFVGVALGARYVVRPLAGAIGWPLERLFARARTARARERDAQPRPHRDDRRGAHGRASGSSSSSRSSRRPQGVVHRHRRPRRQRRPRRPLRDHRARCRAGAGRAVAGVRRRRDRWRRSSIDQVKVNGEAARASSPTSSTASTRRPARALYASTGCAADRRADRAPARRQRARRGAVRQGPPRRRRRRFRIETPRAAGPRCASIGEYRDPQLLQGIDRRPADPFARVSAARDPWTYLRRPPRAAIRPPTAERHDRSCARGIPDRQGPSSRAQYNADAISAQLDQIVYLLYALLAMSVVISLFGIANSLFLSIHERTREFGLLRAVGATPRQVRRMVRYESVITAVIGGAARDRRGAAVRLPRDPIAGRPRSRASRCRSASSPSSSCSPSSSACSRPCFRRVVARDCRCWRRSAPSSCRSCKNRGGACLPGR